MQVPSRPARAAANHGFTLVELMVTIAIVVALAALVFFGAQRVKESARIASNISNLRNLGQMVTMIADENRSFPPGWSFAKSESWADLVVREMHGDTARQDDLLLSPVQARNIPSDLDSTAISNYAVNPFVFVQEDVTGSRGYTVTSAKLRRPAEQILLGDALPRSDDAPYGFSMVVWWDLINSGRSGNRGNPPVSPPQRANRKISWPAGIAEMTSDGGAGLPAFRNRGKGHFVFADGHVEALGPEELRFKHFAISY